MSTSQFRIREFDTANERLAAAEGKVARELKELQFQEEEVKKAEEKVSQARSRLELLEKRLATQRARVQSDREELEKAELNLKEVEHRWQVHDVDDDMDVTPSSPPTSTTDANAVEDVIDIASPNSTRTTSINSSNVSLNNGDDEGFDNFFATLSPLSNDSVNEDDYSGNANVQHAITSDEEETGSYVDESINATFSAPGNAFVNANNDEITINAPAEKACLFESIVVRSCGVSGANGKYKPAKAFPRGDQFYSKTGYYQGQAVMFHLWRDVSHSRWRIDARRNGHIFHLYISKKRDELKDEYPRREEWSLFYDGVLPFPIITWNKNNQA